MTKRLAEEPAVPHQAVQEWSHTLQIEEIRASHPGMYPGCERFRKTPTTIIRMTRPRLVSTMSGIRAITDTHEYLQAGLMRTAICEYAISCRIYRWPADLQTNPKVELSLKSAKWDEVFADESVRKLIRERDVQVQSEPVQEHILIAMTPHKESDQDWRSVTPEFGVERHGFRACLIHFPTLCMFMLCMHVANKFGYLLILGA